MQRNVNCPSCNRGLFTGDAFCSWCGTPLGDRDESSGQARREHATKTISTSDLKTCTSCNSPILPSDTFCATCGARYGEVEVPLSSQDSHIPTQLVDANRGKYEILRELGRGGMGYVYLARDLELERLDAIKVLKPSMLAEDGMVERFKREARTIANLRHQSIVTVYGVGQAGNLHYFVMDYIEGVSLSRILKQTGRLSIQAIEAILYQVGSALSYAHKSVVHRDVKPANIMLTRQGRAIVTDFGIAKVTEVQGGLTRTGVLMGTPEYMSPEQCREAAVTHHTDQYALGAVCFAMLTGSPPFTGQWLTVAAAHQTKPIPKIKDFRPDCPDNLAETIEKMLAKYPSERWPDIKDALRHLELRPLAPDDPAIEEIIALVESTMAVDEAERAGRAPVAPISSRTPTDLRIVRPPEEVEIGDTVQLHASMIFDDGLEAQSQGVRWESTDPSIARVDSDTGELVGVNVGSVEIRAMHGTVSGSLSLGVVAPRVSQLVIHPQNVRLRPGETVQLRAEARSKRGETLARRVSWSSSDVRMARVSDEGLVTAYQPGTTSVLANCEGSGSAATINVVTAGSDAPTVAASPGGGYQTPVGSTPSTGGVVPDYGGVTPPSGSQYGPPAGAPLSGGDVPASGGQAAPQIKVATAPARDVAPVWRRPAVLVPLLLLVAAVASLPFLPFGPFAGQELAATLRITDALTGDPVESALELPVGETLRLNATVRDAAGQPMPGRGVTWRSEDTRIVQVSEAGVLTAVAGGLTSVTAIIDSIARPIPVSVSVPVTTVTLRGPSGFQIQSLAMTVGETASLGVDVMVGESPGDTDDVAWRSSDPEIASVDEDGRVTARRAGSTTIEARYGDVTATLATIVASEVVDNSPVILQIQVGPAYADLYVDGELRGEGLRSYTVSLRPGSYTIQLLNPRFQPHQETVQIRPGQASPVLQVTLTPR